MNVRIHRDYARMITSKSWSHSHRFSLIKDTSLDNSGIQDSNDISHIICEHKQQYQAKAYPDNEYFSGIMKTGREFANNTMNNT